MVNQRTGRVCACLKQSAAGGQKEKAQRETTPTKQTGQKKKRNQNRLEI
jgi:hypothetical protein